MDNQENKKPEYIRQIIISLISLVLSIAASVVPDWEQLKFTKADEILVGVGIFIVLQLMDLIWLAGRLTDRARHEDAIWVLREECDAHLLNISRCFTRLAREAYGSRDVFVAHFRKQINQLASSITEVAERRQLSVQADHFLTVDNVLDAFQGDSERILRYSWPLEDGHGQLFEDLSWRRYFERTTEMIAANEIAEVRTILLVDDDTVVSTPRVSKLLDFYKSNAGFSCRVVRENEFRTLCDDNQVSSRYIDFGIYGSRLLFLTEQYEPVIKGVFTKDVEKICHYTSLFDTMWRSPSVAQKNPSTVRSTVSLENLFKFDSVCS